MAKTVEVESTQVPCFTAAKVPSNTPNTTPTTMACKPNCIETAKRGKIKLVTDWFAYWKEVPKSPLNIPPK